MILLLKARKHRLDMKKHDIADNTKLINVYLKITKNWIKSIANKNFLGIMNDNNVKLTFISSTTTRNFN